MSEPEVALSGGRITPGIVRVGDTVRRPMTGDRSAVHSLLRHLEESGFDGVPRFLGVDDRAREILSFLPGEVPRDLDHFSDAQLAAAARLLRRFHDATTSLAAGQAGEVICHNDWGPHNAVFQDELPYGIIDFDTIAPGLRLWDIGYSAFSWLDMGNSDYRAKSKSGDWVCSPKGTVSRPTRWRRSPCSQWRGRRRWVLPGGAKASTILRIGQMAQRDGQSRTCWSNCCRRECET